MRLWTRVVAVATVFVVMSACGGGGGDGGTGPNPSFTMSISPSSLTLSPGTPVVGGGAGDPVALADASGNVTVSITRSGGFEGAVTVAVEGLPAGVTAPSMTIGAGSSSGMLTITAGITASAGLTSITIRGSADGLAARTATVSVTVTAPPAMMLALSPTTLAVEQGQSGLSAATITRTGGFAGQVTLTSSGAPTGMTVGFNPTETAGNTSTITVTVGGSVAAGQHAVTITASGAGVANATAVLTVTVSAPVPPAIALSVAPTGLSIPPGQSGNAAVTVARTNFSGTVNFTSSGGVINIGIEFTPPSTTGNTTNVTVNVGPAVPPGVYEMTLTGSGTGISDASTTLTVTVPSGSSIAISLDPSALTIQQGSVGNSTVTVTRTNFVGQVQLLSSGVPANVSVTFNPTGINGTTGGLTVTVQAGATPGTYPITIHASGLNVTDATALLTVTVTSSGAGGNVSFTFCDQSGQPLWFASQNDGGAWSQVAGVGGVYSFTANPRGAVAYVMPDGARTELIMFYGSAPELNVRGDSFCDGSGGTRTINGSVASLGLAELASMYMNGASTTLFSVAGPFVLNDVADGVQDLIATRTTIGITPVVNSVLFLRDQDLANDANVGVLDFSTGVVPSNFNATISNLGADQAVMSSLFLSKNGTGVPIFTGLPAASANHVWRGIPAPSTVAGDFHIQSVLATPNGNLTGFPFRGTAQFNRTASDRTYGLPAFIVIPPSVTVAGTAPYVTINHSWAIESSDFNDFWSLILTPAAGSVSSVSISGSEGYFGGGPVQLNLPVFGAGFNPAWGLQPGTNVMWNFLANGGPAWGTGVAAAVEGAIAYSAGVGGNFTP